MPYGNDGSIGICFQDSYGTSKVNSMNYIPLNDEDLTLGIEDLVSQEMTGNFDEGASYPGKRSANGGLNMDIDMDSLGVCLRAVMGPAIVTSANGVTNHNFTPRTVDFDDKCLSEPLSVLVDLNDGGSAQLYYDCVGTELEFGLAGGELYKLKLGLMGGKYKQSVAQVPAFSTDSKWAWNEATFTMSADTITDLKDISVKINENAEEVFVIDGTTEPGYVKRSGTRTVEISGTMLFNDQTELQAFISQSEREMYLNMQANSFSISVFAPKFKYTAFPVNLSGPNQLEAAFTGKAKYYAVGGYSLRVILVNTHGIYQ